MKYYKNKDIKSYEALKHIEKETKKKYGNKALMRYGKPISTMIYQAQKGI